MWVGLICSTACGGRNGHDSSRAEPRGDLVDAALDAHLGSHDASAVEAPSDAALPMKDASVDSAASFDGAPRKDGGSRSEEASLDAPSDALLAPDCHCPPGDYFVDATIDGKSAHLAEPFVLDMLCEEESAELIHPCEGDFYRLLACNGEGSSPPCVYVAVAPSLGLHIGFLTTQSGQTWSLEDGAISPDATAHQVGTGSFSATFAGDRDGSTISVSGTYRACVPRMPECASR
jgi:hypothetical protein